MSRDLTILMGWVERSASQARGIPLTPETLVRIDHQICTVIAAMQSRGQARGVSLRSVSAINGELHVEFHEEDVPCPV